MATLLARLAAPVQAWGAEPSLRVATTHSTPTWSGLLGLARAALGHSHTDPPDTISWLRALTMAVRVDQPGTVRPDYHTVTPLPAAYERRFGIPRRALGLVPLGKPLRASGAATHWLNSTAALPTNRHLLHDAAFLWLTSGPDDDIHRLADALAHPRWTLSLGRKAATPSAPLLLGVHPQPLLELAHQTPHLTGHSSADRPAALRQTVELVWLHGGDPTTPGASTRTVLDNPTGSHPQHGYRPTQHLITRIPSPPKDDLLAWATQHLTHPDRPAPTRESTP